MTKIFQIDTSGQLASSLISYYKCDNDATDYYGINNATATNLTYTTPGKIGYAGDTATTTRFNLGNAPFNFATGDFTISMWAYLSNTTSLQCLCVRGIVGPPYEQYALYVNTSVFNFWLRNSAGTTYTATSNVPSANTWHHVVARCLVDTISVFINNVKGTDAVFAGSRFSLSADTHVANGVIANNALDVYPLLNGYFDEVAVWNRGLSTQEITDLYNSGAGQTMTYLTSPTYPIDSSKVRISLTQPSFFPFGGENGGKFTEQMKNSIYQYTAWVNQGKI